MLLPNNDELDTDALAKKVENISVHRRHLKSLSIKPEAAFLKWSAGKPKKSGRETIKKIPLLGSAIAGGYRKIRNLTMPGLNWKQRVRLVPGLGSFAVWLNALLRLTEWRQRIALELEHQHAKNYAVLADVNRRLNQHTEHLRLADERSNSTHDALRQINDRMRQAETENRERDNRIAALIQKMRHQIQTSAAPAGTSPTSAASAGAPVNIDLNTFYLEFEEKFRGTRDDIRERLKVYLPYLAHLGQNNDNAVVDIGCGRGEWLELLRDNGIRAIGIDLNGAMVDACRERGLAAECADAIDWLKQQPEGSVAAITGFHIVEHLPFVMLVALFDAALHALRDDGLIIFETPNPENLTVGACTFYCDPTHQRPIVPAVAEFIARQRGFAKAEILPLHPYPESAQLQEDTEVNRRVNQVFYGPQDYAVLAWKRHGN